MQNKKTICLIAQFPPPMHGLSKAVDTLYKSAQMNEDYSFVKVDITNNKKILKNLKIISRTNADLYYFTISQSIGGNLRDLLILKEIFKHKKKCVIHLHGGYYRKLLDGMNPVQKKLNVRALNQLDGTIVLGESLKYIFNGLVPDSKIYVVPNCVDTEYLAKNTAIKEKCSNIPEELHVLYLSNFIRSKGYDKVLELAKEYSKSSSKKKLHFDFAGQFFEENEREYFNTFVKDNGLENIVTYHGVVSGDEKRSLLKNSYFFVLPTCYPKEGQPISILEAMGNGLIILSTTHSGIPDIATNDINGCVIPYCDDIANDYLRYIDELTDTDICKVILENYRTVSEHFNEDTYIKNLKNVFNSVMD